MSTFSKEAAGLADIIAANGSNWGAISADSAARMRAQNQFKTGLDIAKYTASVMRHDMAEYDADPSAYTQSLGCWHGFIGQQKLISIKKHFGTTKKKYLYLSGWMVAALRSDFGPLPDQSMHEKTSVASLINELYTFLRQADARELSALFRELDAASDETKPLIQEKINKRIVLAGGPSTGKTSVIYELTKLKFHCFKEAARDILSDYKQRGSEFKSDPIKISEEIFKRRHHDYKIADTLNCKENLAFYDRGIHEITAYLRSIDNSSSYWDNLPSNYHPIGHHIRRRINHAHHGADRDTFVPGHGVKWCRYC